MPRTRPNKRIALRPKSGPKESAPGKKAAKRQSRLHIAEFNAWGISPAQAQLLDKDSYDLLALTETHGGEQQLQDIYGDWVVISQPPPSTDPAAGWAMLLAL
eukprot:COSAG01_NODE_8850_length_2637_cov_93.572498_2_plen_102_part_00